MIVRRVFPGEPLAIDLDDDSSRSALLEWYRPETEVGLRLNLIASISGALAGADGTSHSLSNPVDRRILGVIRELSDVVLVGAQTVRAEGYQLPRRAALAVLSSSGDLAGASVDSGAGGSRLLVLTRSASVDRVRTAVPDAEIVVLPDDDGRVRVEDAVSALRERGLESIVSEGGPSLAGALLDAGLVDELCLSTGPTVNGSPIGTLANSVIEPQSATLRHLLIDDNSAVYTRWALTAAGSARS